MKTAVIGIDIGGTNAKVCAVSPQNKKILHRGQVPTLPGEGPGALFKRLGDLWKTWQGEANFKIARIGVGIAGDVDHKAGRLRYSPNLPGWERFRFSKILSRRYHCPVTVQNDANMAVWGGYVLELGSRPRNVCGITLGTGVGGGLVLRKRLYRGALGSAGEIGHTIVETNGRPCHCGQRGCLEAYAGSYGIIRIAREALEQHPEKGETLLRLCGKIEDLEPRHLGLAAAQGDPLARDIWFQVAQYLAIGLSHLVLILNPEAILILGGISKAGKWLKDPLEEAFARHPFKAPFGFLKIHLAHDGDLGCVGAALFALEKDV